MNAFLVRLSTLQFFFLADTRYALNILVLCQNEATLSRVTNALANLKQCFPNIEPLIPVPLVGAVKSSGIVLEKDALHFSIKRGVRDVLDAFFYKSKRIEDACNALTTWSFS